MLGIELGASCMLGRHSTNLAASQIVLFSMVICFVLFCFIFCVVIEHMASCMLDKRSLLLFSIFIKIKFVVNVMSFAVICSSRVSHAVTETYFPIILCIPSPFLLILFTFPKYLHYFNVIYACMHDDFIISLHIWMS